MSDPASLAQSSLTLASRVLAATDKVVSQALQGAWSEVPQTVAQRRGLLSELTARSASNNDPWLLALQQAVAESDAALQTMTPAQTVVESSADNPVGDALHTALRQSLITASITGR